MITFAPDHNISSQTQLLAGENPGIGPQMDGLWALGCAGGVAGLQLECRHLVCLVAILQSEVVQGTPHGDGKVVMKRLSCWMRPLVHGPWCPEALAVADGWRP
jgi:hypothetical protein